VYYDSTRASLLRRTTPDISGGGWQWWLGVVAAELGRRDEALNHARRAVELIPMATDRSNHDLMRLFLARVLARVGDADAAVAELEYLLSVPSDVSVPALRMDPAWEPLRAHPRFRRLLERQP
jgi:tetratricopeptide (TPR) repeat protein